MSFAPIAVFAFRRLDLLRQTLGALERCAGFASSPIHVFSDGPRIDNDGEKVAVDAVRAWLKAWCEEHGAELHSAPENLGLRRSITSGVRQVLQRHERIVVLEDDIVVSPAFLEFMNEALGVYANDEKVVQVSGYFVPNKDRLPRAGFLGVPACWGWATWRRAWQLYRDDALQLLNEIRDHDEAVFDINGSYAYLESLEQNANGARDTWLVRWYASVFLRDGLTLYPGKSLTRNIGFGEEGTNCGPGTMAHVFANQSINNDSMPIDWSSVRVEESPRFRAALEAFYRWQHHQWTKPSWRDRLAARIKLATGTNART